MAGKMVRAPVAELVDAADSKSVVLWDVGVRVSLGAPYINLFKGQFRVYMAAIGGSIYLLWQFCTPCQKAINFSSCFASLIYGSNNK